MQVHSHKSFDRDSFLQVVGRCFLVFSAGIVSLIQIPAQSPEKKGIYTLDVKSPVNAHIANTVNIGRVKKVRGRIMAPDAGWAPIKTVISVYVIDFSSSRFLFSFFVGAKGKFSFPELLPGTYLLKTGTTDGYYNQVDFELVLAPKDKTSSDKDLNLRMEVGT